MRKATPAPLGSGSMPPPKAIAPMIITFSVCSAQFCWGITNGIFSASAYTKGLLSAAWSPKILGIEHADLVAIRSVALDPIVSPAVRYVNHVVSQNIESEIVSPTCTLVRTLDTVVAKRIGSSAQASLGMWLEHRSLPACEQDSTRAGFLV
jgi:hypothetical protein